MRLDYPTQSQRLRLLDLAEHEPGTRVVGVARCPVLRMEDGTTRFVSPSGRVLPVGNVDRSSLSERTS